MQPRSYLLGVTSAVVDTARLPGHDGAGQEMIGGAAGYLGGQSGCQQAVVEPAEQVGVTRLANQ